jgi:hypothetical protein
MIAWDFWQDESRQWIEVVATPLMAANDPLLPVVLQRSRPSRISLYGQQRTFAADSNSPPDLIPVAGNPHN